MKKRISILLIAILFLPCIFVFSACGEKKYDVNFMLNSSVYYTIQTSGNEEITLPLDPNIKGYDFDGWYFDNGTWQDKLTKNSFENKKLTSNRYVYVKLVAKKYTITWKNFDGTILEIDENVPYNTMPYYNGETPRKEGDVQYKYIFNGWSPSVSNVVGNQTYTAQFKQEINKYTISWLNEDGSLIKSTNVDYGSIPNFNGVPTKEAEGKYYYTFKNWEPSLSTVVGDAQYTAIFEKHECTEFKINYDANGGVGAPNTQTKYKNIDLILSKLKPTKAGYRFVGWNNIYEDKIYHAGDTFSTDLNLTLVAMWEQLCSHCNGVGSVQNEVNCSTCSGKGSITTTTATYCSNCGGDGEYLTNGSTCAICSGSGKMTSVCSSCNGYGGYYLCKCSSGHSWYANDSSKYCPYCGKYMNSGKLLNTCSSCSGSGTVKKTCSTCSGSGKVGVTLRTCSICSGTGIKTTTTTKTCSQCSGSGKKSQTTTCTYCNDGIIKPLAPTYLQINDRSVILKAVEGYEYSLDGDIWQQSNTFENLHPSTEYTFYQRVATKDNVPFGVTSLPLKVTTKSSNLFYVSYDLDGGINHEDNPIQYYTSNPNITLHNPTREHYDFTGWKYEGSIVTEIKASWAKDIILTATWTLHNYQINYNLSGGTTTNLTSYTIKTNSFTLADATRKGYTFVGWIGSNGNVPEKNVVINNNSPQDLSFEAVWEIITYTIEYDFNGGYFSGEKITNYTVEDEIDLCQPIKEEYDFIGWKYHDRIINIIEKGTTGNITLIAEWILHRYKITYDLKGGTNNNTNPLWFNVESENIILQSPTKDGYKFIGWTGSNGISPEINVTIPKGSKEDKKYTANWTANNYDISFDANNGVVKINSITVTFDDEYTLPIPTRVGYQFDGWYYNDTLYTDGVWKTSQNITLTANWTPNTNTTYQVKHYRENIENDEYVLFETENFTGTSDSTINLSVKSYYGFNSPATQTTTISADGTKVINYYYTRVKYTLTIIKNDGNTETKDIKYQANIANAITVSRDGYTFGGYFTDETLSEQIIIMPSNNTIVYVWWQEETKPMYITYRGTSSITITGYTGEDTKLQIPTYIGNKIVKTISASSIVNNETLTEIVVPDSVTNIGEGAFKGCNKLTSITLPFVGKTSSVSTSVGDGNSSYLFGYIFGCTTIYTSGYSTRPTNTTTLTYQGQDCYRSSSGNYYYAMYYIPQTLRNVTITKATGISANAFYGCSYLTSVTLNAEVTIINQNAFYGCSGLTSFVVPTNTTSIGSYAFYNNSSISDLTLPNGLKYINDYAFYNTTSLKNLTLSSELLSIGDYAFYNTRLESLTIPSKVTSIGDYAFQNDAKLTTLTIPANVKTIGSYAFSGCVNISTLTLYNGITSIGHFAFENLSITTVTVPNSVTSIGEGAFKGCNKLTSITLPFVGKTSSVSTSVGDGNSRYLFGYIFGCTTDTLYTSSSLTRPTNTTTLTYQGQDYYRSSSGKYYYAMYYIPQTLRNVTITKATGISANAFYGCSYLTSVTLNAEVTIINQKAFYGCSGLTSFVVPTNTTSIGSYAFYNNSSISNLTLPNGLKYINDYAFYNTTSLKNLTLSSELLSIGDYAFYNTRLESLIIPSKVTSIGDYAFQNDAKLTTLTIPANVKTIGNYAFSGCVNISTLTLNNGITSIGNFAFQNLSITTVTVPNSVTSIGEGAFKGCNKLTSITLPFVGKTSSVSTSIGDGNSSYLFGYIFGCTTDTSYTSSSLTCPTNTTTLTYQGQDYYRSSSGKYYYAMYYIPQTLRNVTITKATGISANAFYGCSYLTSVTLNKEVTVINSSAFYNCSGLTSFTVPENTTTIRDYAFYGCSSMESILLPYGLKSVGANVFSNCSKLNINCQIDEQPSGWNTNWNPSSCLVTWNYGCTKGITEDGFDWISLDGETVRIRGYSGNATELTIPNSIEGKPVTRIDANTFRDNSKITLIKIPNSVNFIETNAFYNLSNLLTVIIPNSVLTIQSNSFNNCLKASFLCENNSRPIGWQSNWCSSTNAITWDYANRNGVTEDGFKWALRSDDTIIIYGYNGTSDIITIPQTINEKTVCAISMNAFRNNKTLTAVHISNSITFIGDYAFSGCSNSIIYCQPDSRPSGWSSSWIDSSMTVYWSM